MKAYRLNGIGAVEGWLTSSHTRTGTAVVASYARGAASIHAAELVADALDRLSGTAPIDYGAAVEHLSSESRGRDSVTDAMDAYLIKGVGVAERGNARLQTSPGSALVTSYMHEAATIHAAEIVAAALDRLRAAIALTTNTPSDAP